MKKGQIRISETIAILFIFFVLIVFGIIFYYKYSLISLEQDREEQLFQKSVEITQKALFLPELICSRGVSETVANCVDLHKVQFLGELTKQESDYYFDVFSYSNITIHQIYPTENKWTVYEHPLPNASKIDSTKFFVAIRDEMQRVDEIQFNLGYIEVGIYS